MDMTGEQRIAASREIVWKALNDPNVLKACIPGCQELVKLSDNEMTATAVIKVGPVAAKFQGAVTLSDFDPPNSYRITGEGQGGVAGFAKGSALVRLEADGDDTILHYNVSAQIGGKLSQLGGRLIDATAKQMSGAFFKRFAQEIAAQYGDGVQNENPAAPEAARSTTQTSKQPAARPRPVPKMMTVPMDVAPGMFKYLKSAGLVLLIGALALAGYVFGGALPGVTSGHISPDFANAVQLIIAAAIGYLFGRQSNSGPVIHIDRDAIDVFADALSRRRD
ncbi:MAG: carbon monoxide dehydrogenase subunit G [Xanthobacteraceae bacterium]|nr:carbon monoxide dehydrogenase subunit G [Xanthobacteraceae bacterium]